VCSRYLTRRINLTSNFPPHPPPKKERLSGLAKGGGGGCRRGQESQIRFLVHGGGTNQVHHQAARWIMGPERGGGFLTGLSRRQGLAGNTSGMQAALSPAQAAATVTRRAAPVGGRGRRGNPNILSPKQAGRQVRDRRGLSVILLPEAGMGYLSISLRLRGGR